MPPESIKLLRDMLDAAGVVEQYTHDQTLKAYLQYRWLRDAVQWNFCVIGEALSKLRQVDPDTAERITDYHRIVGFRNQLIHGYGVVDHHLTWTIITDKLPVLIHELQQLLGERDSSVS